LAGGEVANGAGGGPAIADMEGRRDKACDSV